METTFIFIKTEPQHVCMHVCMCVCMYACMHVCMYVCIHVCILSSEVSDGIRGENWLYVRYTCICNIYGMYVVHFRGAGGCLFKSE